jgi:hypothetical protein
MRAFSPAIMLSAQSLLAACGLANPVVGTGDQPQCFFWQQAPSAWDDDEFDERFLPIVRIDVESLSGTNAALAVKAEVASLVLKYPANDDYILDHVCILLQNFGVSGATKLNQDPIDAPSPWPDIDGVEDASRNPWLNTGAIAAKDWMAEFIEELSDGVDAVTPFRFHFDTEVPLCTYTTRNEVALAINVFDEDGITNDARWNDTDWKIPVGDPYALTLKQHWGAALGEFTL